MFDIGFWELLLIGVVALLVIGPERLPGVARKVGYYIGRVQRFVAGVKADIHSQLEAGDLRDMLSEQEKQISELRSIVGEQQKQVETATRDAISAGREAYERDDAGKSSGHQKQAGEREALPERQRSDEK